jgi:D-amino-acid oxidase
MPLLHRCTSVATGPEDYPLLAQFIHLFTSNREDFSFSLLTPLLQYPLDQLPSSPKLHPQQIQNMQFSKQDHPVPSPQSHIIILGAGVTGLSTAVKLASTPNLPYKITIIATHLPGDESIDYTSPWAGGDWSPQATSAPEDAHMRAHDTITYNAWTHILNTDSAEAKKLGLGFKLARTYWGKDGPDTGGGDGRALWWKDVVRDFEVLDLKTEKEAPEGAVMGVGYMTICVDVPQHLRYLMERVQDAGVNVIKSDVDVSHGLEGVVKEAKRLVSEKEGVKGEDVFALINCTGLGARHFVGDVEAAKLFPKRGQTILVKGEATMDRTYDDFPPLASTEDDDLVYVIPRPGSGTTIFGGCGQAGNWDPKVDEKLNERIIEGIKKWELAEELRAKGGARDFDVISSQVGLRPGRKGGPRVEIEGAEKVEGSWVIHSYGHAGAGYQSSVGCSEKVATLIAELVEK